MRTKRNQTFLSGTSLMLVDNSLVYSARSEVTVVAKPQIVTNNFHMPHGRLLLPSQGGCQGPGRDARDEGGYCEDLATVKVDRP